MGQRRNKGAGKEDGREVETERLHYLPEASYQVESMDVSKEELIQEIGRVAKRKGLPCVITPEELWLHIE